MSAAEVASIEVSDKASRRRFTAEYKRRIVKEAAACRTPGAIGELLRREGLYSSHLTTWRAARDRGELGPGATTKKRGPKPQPRDPRDVARITQLEREVDKQTARAERAEAIAEIQKKLSQLLGINLPTEKSS
jgi:transposase-like protein